LKQKKEPEAKQQEANELYQKLETSLSQLDESKAKQNELKVSSDHLTDEVENKKGDIVALEGTLQVLEEKLDELEKKRQEKANVLVQLEKRLAMHPNQETKKLVRQSQKLEQEISHRIANIKSEIYRSHLNIVVEEISVTS